MCCLLLILKETIWLWRCISRIMELLHVFLTHRSLQYQYQERYIFQLTRPPEVVQNIDRSLVHGIHYRYQDQRKEGRKNQSVYHRPCQRPPERHVITAKINMRFKGGEQSGKVNIKAYCQRDQTKNSSNS